MFEKICASLLLLLPRAFRKRYKEESLRLLRDRLQDERGVYGRLRLIWDLLTDVIGALPQAYKNSYAEATAAASLVPNTEGVPSFQILESKPIRRETVFSGCVLSLATLAVLTYLMARPAPYQPVQQNGRVSPVIAVLERFHESTEDLPGADDSKGSAVGAGDQSRPAYTAGAYSQSVRSSGSVGETGSFERGTAAAIPASSANSCHVPSSTFTPAGTSFAMLRSPDSAVRPNLPDAEVRAAAASLAGSWILRGSGGSAGIPQGFIFKQNGAELRVTAGLGSSDQHPIVLSSFADGSVRFEWKDGERSFLYDLRRDGSMLQGTLSIKQADKVLRVMQVQLEAVR